MWGFFFFHCCSKLLSRDPRKEYPLDAFLILENSLEAELESSVFSSFFCNLNATDHMHMKIVTVNANSPCSVSGWVFEKQKKRFPLGEKKSKSFGNYLKLQ